MSTTEAPEFGETSRFDVAGEIYQTEFKKLRNEGKFTPMAESLATMTPATTIPFALPEALQALLDAFLVGVRAQPAERPILRLIAGDASDRKFFRLENTDRSAICMQFPIWEGGYGGDPLSWLGMHAALDAIGMPVPRVLHIDEPNCCIWTEDFGDNFLNSELSGDVLDAANIMHAKGLTRYRAALDLLVEAQYPRTPMPAHPAQGRAFDFEKLHFEMRFFFKHFMRGFLGLDTPDAALEAELTALCSWLDARPRVLCHRDYHVRNVMIAPNGELGWIDFQDARMGPHAYDVVSLVRDSYVRIDAPTRALLYGHYLKSVNERKASQGLPPLDSADFGLECVHMGLQRNVKALGSFGYLATEKRKPSYLRYVPHTLETLVAPESGLARLYPNTHAFLVSLQNGPMKKLLEAKLEEFGVSKF